MSRRIRLAIYPEERTDAALERGAEDELSILVEAARGCADDGHGREKLERDHFAARAVDDERAAFARDELECAAAIHRPDSHVVLRRDAVARLELPRENCASIERLRDGPELFELLRRGHARRRKPGPRQQREIKYILNFTP